MEDKTSPITLGPKEGRSYPLGKQSNTQVTFKADGKEVNNQYSITEWWMDPQGPGPAPHVHDVNDEIIYVLQGPVAVLVGDEWKSLEKGGIAIIPAGITHTFKNESDQRVGILNIFLSGAYEAFMPQITAMYANQ